MAKRGKKVYTIKSHTFVYKLTRVFNHVHKRNDSNSIEREEERKGKFFSCVLDIYDEEEEGIKRIYFMMMMNEKKNE
jgi:hypothetical protein